jgi:hypothetical protein
VPFTASNDIDVLRLQDQYHQAAYPEGREPTTTDPAAGEGRAAKTRSRNSDE